MVKERFVWKVAFSSVASRGLNLLDNWMWKLVFHESCSVFAVRGKMDFHRICLFLKA